jgi:hypothetical protein
MELIFTGFGLFDGSLLRRRHPLKRMAYILGRLALFGVGFTFWSWHGSSALISWSTTRYALTSRPRELKLRIFALNVFPWTGLNLAQPGTQAAALRAANWE